MAVNYKELGLVNTREMFKRAVKGGYAIPAFNFNNLEQLQAIITAASETKSPVILQVSKGARAYANPILLRYMAEGAVEYAKSLGCNHPEIVLHLDHGDSFELVKGCVDLGFSSVATRSPSPSVRATALTSSSPSSARATRRPVVSFLLPWPSTFSTRSRRSSPASPSSSTDLPQCLRSM